MHIIGTKKLIIDEQSHALTLLKQNVPINRKALDSQASRQTINAIKKGKGDLPHGCIPKQKTGSKRRRKV